MLTPNRPTTIEAHPGTANAFALRGARLVFVDIREDNCNINEQQALAAMGEYTRALVAVHYAGVGCDMPSLLEACRRHGAYLVEDAAHALFASFRGAPLGSFGTLVRLPLTNHMSEAEQEVVIRAATSFG